MEEKLHNRRSPLIPSSPDVRETFSEPAECSKSNQGNTEIMEMLVSMKKEMDEKEKMWEQQLELAIRAGLSGWAGPIPGQGYSQAGSGRALLKPGCHFSGPARLYIGPTG